MFKGVPEQSESAQETMLLPLWGRARTRQTCPDLLVDPHAEEIIARLDYDFSKIEKSMGGHAGIGWVIRARRFDDAVKAFIADHPAAMVVNLGAGLDTTFSRVHNGNIIGVDREFLIYPLYAPLSGKAR